MLGDGGVTTGGRVSAIWGRVTAAGGGRGDDVIVRGHLLLVEGCLV